MGEAAKLLIPISTALNLLLVLSGLLSAITNELLVTAKPPIRWLISVLLSAA